MHANVHRFDLSDPGDVSGLAAAIADGRIESATIVAVIGKTHGNGLVNDYTRGFLAQSLAWLLSERLGVSPDEVLARVPFVFSGGVEGILSPHYCVFTVEEASTPADGGPGFAVATARTAPLGPEAIGRQAQIDATSDAVKRAMANAGIDGATDVHFVQIKGPAYTHGAIAAANAAGGATTAQEPGQLMALCRAASALGIAAALGDGADATEDRALKDFGVWSGVASCSAGVEVDCNEVIVMGMARGWSGNLAIAHAPMKDALDIDAVHETLAGLGMTAAHQLDASARKRLRAVFVKGEAARSGKVWGREHTMLNDGDIDQQRHIRAALGAAVASVLGEPQIFVSGGAEHQGPPDGGLVAIIAERP